MPRTHVPYPPEFRAEAIRLVRASGKPVDEIARQLEVSHETLRAWIKQADIDDGLRHDGLTTEETEEVRQLRREVKLIEQIRAIHATSRQTYGAPRIHAELADAGVRCGRKRVAHLMRGAGIVGCHRRRHVVSTVREPASQVVPDRLERQFVTGAPNTKWTADITYVPTWSGFLSLAVVLDVFSRRIVGWAT